MREEKDGEEWLLHLNAPDARNAILSSYPPNSHAVLPSVPPIEEYIDPAKINEPTTIGGRYNWEGPDSYPYAGAADC